MIAGMWCNRVVLVKRSAMERMTLARYFAVSWRRSAPLWGVFGGEQVALRAGDTPEASRVRVNECPYATLHGMSLGASGFAFDERRRLKKQLKGYSLLMEMQWVKDPSANIENWGLTDIEKILQEAWQLNPHGPKSMTLPGEMFLNVGQNPKVGSSIKQTQHTQLCAGSLSTYPLLQVTSKAGPRFSSALDARVDFVNIGLVEDAPELQGFFVKVHTTKPTSPKIVEFLVEMRLRLLASFGGAEVIDFMVTCVNDECGGFVILFAPIPQLEKIGTMSPDLASWKNPTTGEISEDIGLEEARIDFGKGVGQFLCMKEALREQLLASGENTLRRIWAFNRVPGISEAVRVFADERKTFE